MTRLSRRGLGLAAVCAVLLGTLALGAGPASAAGPHARTATEKATLSAVFSRINGYRKAHGLPALRMNLPLANSARAHDARMATAQTLSHQLPGESSPCSRMTAAGYRWSWCGENIGWTSQRTTAGALAIIAAMYAETPPNDGHRRNFLSRSFRDVGVDAYQDPTHGRLWLTMDFGRTR